MVSLNVWQRLPGAGVCGAICPKQPFDKEVYKPNPYDPAAQLGAYIPDDYPMESRSIWGELRYRF